MINIKLMKVGGISGVEKINVMVEVCGVECMVGSMIEMKLGIMVVVYFVVSKRNIICFDFDVLLMLKIDVIKGGIIYRGSMIVMFDRSGFGIIGVVLLKGEIE